MDYIREVRTPEGFRTDRGSSSFSGPQVRIITSTKSPCRNKFVTDDIKKLWRRYQGQRLHGAHFGFYNLYRNRTCRYNYMQRNYVVTHCDDFGMHQLLPTTEQISRASNRSILTIIGLEHCIDHEWVIKSTHRYH